MNRLKEKYFKEVVPSLKEKYHYTTLMAVPKIEKIVINMGVGEAVFPWDRCHVRNNRS